MERDEKDKGRTGDVEIGARSCGEKSIRNVNGQRNNTGTIETDKTLWEPDNAYEGKSIGSTKLVIQNGVHR